MSKANSNAALADVRELTEYIKNTFYPENVAHYYHIVKLNELSEKVRAHFI